jgi:XTP/dITP diphosphohydrolase
LKVYFVTVNPFKADEVRTYFAGSGFDLEIVSHAIQEILHIDLTVIVRDKVLKAYRDLRLPCVVEHGGLQIDALKGLPGGLSKVVWDTVGDQLCSFLRANDPRTARAKSVIGYCDGKGVYTFSGETRGQISECGRGDYKFQWDPVFIPDGATETYAQMGFPRKKDYSQAAKAWSAFLSFLRHCSLP